MFNYCSKIIWDSFSIKLIRTFGLYYLLLVVVFNFIQTNSISYTPIWIILSLISTFTSALYETILIENIRLGNYVQTQDKIKAKRVARKFRSGGVYINGNSADPGTPFGGYRQSGNGREGGVWGLEEYLEVKTVTGWK